MSDVFISYKRENQAAVNRLVEALRAEGVSVWWDQDIPPNAPWEATIEKALADAKLVVVAWSPASVASDNVKAEARWARGQGRLLQVFVEACDPPLFFGERQGVDLKGWSGGTADAAFRTLLQAVRAGPTPAPQEAASEALAAPLPLPSKPSIAVMPFANLSGDPEQEYFADGMVVEIVEALSRCRSIFVIASGSGLSFKGKGVSAQEAARQLGVRYVLDGSVRSAANRVRIGVQLVDASDGSQIWTHRFEDTLADVFALQDKVALAVAGKIEPTVQQAEFRRASARPTENMGSYDLYLRSLTLMRTFGRSNVLLAIELLSRAIAIDPDYAAVLSLLSNCYNLVQFYGWSDDPDHHRRQALDLAYRVLKVAGDDPVALAGAAVTLANLAHDLETALPLVDRATSLNPGSATVWLYGGMVRMIAGQVDRGIEHIEASMRLDPMGPNRPGQVAWMGAALMMQGKFAEAAAFEREVVPLTEWPLGYALLAASLGQLGQAKAAQEALERYRSLSSTPIEAVGRLLIDDPSFERIFLEGIAVAVGKSPTDTTADTR